MHRDELPIPSPCSADWSGMDGDRARRFCGACTKHVHDLSEMTAAEARDLLTRERSTGLCVRYTARPDGRIRHRSVLASTARALALGATLVSMPAMAATQPRTDGSSVLDALEALAAAAAELITSDEVLLGEPAIDLGQLEVGTEAVHAPMGQVAIIPEALAEPQPPPEMPTMGDIAMPVPEPLNVRLGKVAAPR
ncbi:MAG: hypothetical protein ACI8PZ_001757 [Myxococcota bacterium]|jgi:hypothetical protein